MLALPSEAVIGKAVLPRVLYVLNVNPAQKFGSMEEQIVFLSQAFRAQGSLFVPLFTFDDLPGVEEDWRQRGVEAHCLNLLRFRWRTFVRLWRLVGALGIDVVHWNMTHPLANKYLWGLTLTRPGVRHIYTDHNSRLHESYEGPVGWKRAAKRLLLKRYGQVWCVSRFVQESLAQQGTWSNLRCCLHFVNTDRFRPDAAARAQMRRQHGVGDRFVITVIAQLIPEKGVDLALRALAELPDNAILWIVGTGTQAEELIGLARTLGVEDRVTFWGLRRNVEPFLQATDCFLLPSRWQEAAGLVVLEAQAAGAPVVASRIGGIPEYVEEGRSALLFPPEDSRQLAAHLRYLCQDVGARQRMGEEARAVALERFSAPVRLPDILDLYRNDR